MDVHACSLFYRVCELFNIWGALYEIEGRTHQPQDEDDCFMNKIYALGYGNWKRLQDFVKYLETFEIGVLVDVRRFPTSKNPEFKRENFEVELPKWGISYVCMSETLGGFRKGGYKKYTETEEYKDGIKQLLEMAKETNIAIMCVEPKAKHCHRRYIIQTLFNMGTSVILLE